MTSNHQSQNNPWRILPSAAMHRQYPQNREIPYAKSPQPNIHPSSNPSQSDSCNNKDLDTTHCHIRVSQVYSVLRIFSSRYYTLLDLMLLHFEGLYEPDLQFYKC